MDWKAGDWVIYGLDVGQIKELRDDGIARFSDGWCETSGHKLADGFRPVTLRNKRIVECFDIYYNRLREIDGEAGFNYPDISRYFSQLVLDAIDGGADEERAACEKGNKFVGEAKNYRPVIDGVPLFRRNLSRASR